MSNFQYFHQVDSAGKRLNKILINIDRIVSAETRGRHTMLVYGPGEDFCMINIEESLDDFYRLSKLGG